jgi:maltose O-acetyltransferase
MNLRRKFSVWRRFPGLSIESGVEIKGDLRNLRVAGKVIVQSGTVLHLGGMEWCQNQGSLELGDGTVISPHCVIYAAGPGGVKIGSHFDCGPGVGIFASRTDYEKGPENHVFAPVCIEDSVTVFAHAVIGPGVTIGDRAVIAAGAVVLNDVPPRCLVAGAPARVIRELKGGDSSRRPPLREASS